MFHCWNQYEKHGIKIHLTYRQLPIDKAIYSGYNFIYSW